MPGQSFPVHRYLHSALRGGFLIVSLLACAQSEPRITAWRAADGLPQASTLGISLDQHGNVLTTHADDLPVARLDGFAITTLSNSIGPTTRVYSSRTSQLWTVARGALLEQTGGGWNVHPVPEIAAEYRQNPVRAVRPIPLLPLDQNRVLILLPDRLLEYQTTSHRSTILREAAATAMGSFHEITAGSADSAWISGARGLLRIPGPISRIHAASELEFHPVPEDSGLSDLQRPFENTDGSVVMAGEDTRTGTRAIVRFDRGRWEIWRVPRQNIRQAWGGPDGELWAHTAGSVLRLEHDGGTLNPRTVLEVGRIADIAIEPRGIAWIATSEGLRRIAPLPWRRAPGFDPDSGPIVAVTSDRRGQVVTLSARAAHRLEGASWRSMPLGIDAREDLVPNAHVMLPLDTGGLLIRIGETNILLATDGSRLALPAELAEAIPLGLLRDGRALLRRKAEPLDQLVSFDGMSTSVFAELPADTAALGNLAFSLQTRTGELWIGGENGILGRRGETWNFLDSHPTGAEDGALSALELPDGRILVGGSDTIREFDGRNWKVIRRGLDQVHGFHLARDGTLWVASGSGLQRFRESSWFNLGEDEGIPSAAVYAVFEDGAGHLWAGTARGLSLLDPWADSDPPRAEVAGADLPPTTGSNRALFVVGGQDRWRFTTPGRLVFSYRLDNNPWSIWRPAASVQFTNLTAGTHRFAVRAMDPSGNTQERPTLFEFAVSLPWFKDPRLVWTSAAVALLLVALGVQAVVSYWRLKRSYAEVESQVAERTAALEKANAELVHSDKMRALGTLAAGVAHDFNNLLSIIKGSAQLLDGELQDPARAHQRIRRIRTAVDQGAALVRAMLGYSRGASAPRKEIDLPLLVQRAIKLLEDRLKGRIRMESLPGPPLPVVHAPPEILQQIVLNLIQNADESMDHRGVVQVELRRSETAPPGCVLKPAPAPAYVIISVRDHGIGIPQENLVRIFEPFFTTKGFSSRRGTGLGLSMVYEFAKEMGAGIAVESTLRRGSCFQVVLPAR